MSVISKNWRNIFRILLLAVFIISSAVTAKGLEGDENRVATIGTGMIAAASLICITLVELYIWNEKKK